MKLLFSIPLALAQLDTIVDDGIEAGIISVLQNRLSKHDFAKLASHGCWCSRMGDEYPLGGSSAVDALDDLCRNWFKQRKCMTLEGGRCHRRQTGYNKAGNPPTCDGAVNLWNINSFCAQDTCTVDDFFANQIVDAINGMKKFRPTFGDDSICPKDVPSESEKMCQGQLPNYQVVQKNSVDQTCQVWTGCFNDSGNNRIMEHRALDVGDDYGGVPNAYDFCRYQCLKEGFSYFGLQNGRECWCNSDNFSSNAKVSDSQCQMDCVDQDDWTRCGNGNRMSVYKIEQTLGEACINEDVRPDAEDEYLGCFKDTNQRAFPFRAPNFYPQRVENANDYCREICDENGYTHYGLQYAYECFCGYETYDKYGQLPESDCNRKCHDQSPDTICGGSWAMSVYKFK